MGLHRILVGLYRNLQGLYRDHTRFLWIRCMQNEKGHETETWSL